MEIRKNLETINNTIELMNGGTKRVKQIKILENDKKEIIKAMKGLTDKKARQLINIEKLELEIFGKIS